MRYRTAFIRVLIPGVIVFLTLQAGAEQPPQTPAAASRQPLFVAIYERGPAWDASKGALQQAGIAEHGAFLQANIDKLIAAAPFQQGVVVGGSDLVVGMVITPAATQEEAERLIASDPAISGKLMKATVRRWLADRVRGY